MATRDFTQDKDPSLFKLQSYGWRKIEIAEDRAIGLLEKAYQTTYAIEGLMNLLQEKMLERNREEEYTISRIEDQLTVAISALAETTNREIHDYAEYLEKKIKQHEPLAQ